MYYRLLNAQTMSFMAEFFFHVTLPWGESVPLMRGQVLAVKAKRPALLHILEVPQEDYDEGYIVGEAFNMFVSDGKTQIEVATESNIYIVGNSSEDISYVHSINGLPEMLEPQIIFASTGVDASCLGTDYTIDERQCSLYVLESQDGVMPKHHLYITNDDLLPIRMSTFLFDMQGRQYEAKRIVFRDWNLEPTFDKDHFDATPPSGSRLIKYNI